MSSQEAVHVSRIKVTPRSGKETLGTWGCHRQRGGRTQSRHKPTHEMELSGEQTIGSRGVCEPALEPRCEWEGSRTRDQDFKPDLGNSAVRHYRGAFENVAMVEMRSQLAIERAGLVTLHLQLARRSSIPTEAHILQDKAAGKTPVAVVASAGTVSTGAVDPLRQIAQIAQRHGAWFHIDGAYGALAAIAERKQFDGMELADSISLDPHK